MQTMAAIAVDKEVCTSIRRSASGTMTETTNSPEAQASNARPATAAPLTPAKKKATNDCSMGLAGKRAAGIAPQLIPVAQDAARSTRSRSERCTGRRFSADAPRQISQTNSRIACRPIITPPQTA